MKDSRRSWLWTLGLINLLNYLDRYVPAGCLTFIQADFGIDDTQGGALISMFMLVYMVASPLGGYLGDRYPRRLLIAGSLLIWSLATVASGLAGTFAILLLVRALIGVGEAGYGSSAPSIISDLVPREQRTRSLAYFYAAIPVGAALGFGLGGVVAEAISWHAAFFIAGAPGIALAVFVLFLKEPPRGGQDAAEEKVPFWVGARKLSGNPSFWVVVAGMALMTFAIGGLASFMPKFLKAERGMDAGTAGILFGGITAVAGLTGTLVGGWLGPWLDRKRAGGGVLLSGAGLLAAAPLMYLAATVRSLPVILVTIGVAQFLIFLNNGPLNAAIVNSVSPDFRAFAMGLNTLLIHLFGDVPSPVIIGAISDRSSLSTAIQVNALPVLIGGAILLAFGSLVGRVISTQATPALRPGA